MWKFRTAYCSYKDVAKRLAKFLLAYWVVELLFLAYSAATGSVLPELPLLLRNLFGFYTSSGGGLHYVNVPFAWYVSFY